MKKIAFILVFVCFCVITIGVEASNKNVIYNDLNTHNLKNKFKQEEIKTIKMLCSYDYCDYVDLEYIEKGLNNFTNGYLNTIADLEVKNILKVKGIAITNVIFE